MRRWGWWLAILIALSVVGAWWTSCNAIRIEPLDANRFAQMSEAERAEWLIRQSLARSKAVSPLSEWLERWFPNRRTALTPLSGMQICMLGEARLKYDLPHLLNRLPAYGENEKATELARLYRALWYAKSGDSQRALREVNTIRAREIRAYALARMGVTHQQSGATELARRCFESAQQLLKQSALPFHPELYLETLGVLVEQTRLRESPEQVADLVRGLPVLYHTAAARRLGQLYLRRNEARRLSALADALPHKAHSALKPYLAVAFIQQGKTREGYELAQRLPADREILDDARIVRALHEAGATRLARRFFTQWMGVFTARVHLHRVRAQLVGSRSLLPNIDVPFWAMLRAGYEAGLWQEAEWVLLAVEPPEMHVLAFLERAAAHYRAGDENKARHFVNLAAMEFRRVQMDIALIHPIRSLREAGAQTLANQFLRQARDHAQQVRVFWLRSAHLRRIAVAYAVNGNYEEAIRTALMLPTLDEQRDTLVGIVGAMTEAPSP